MSTVSRDVNAPAEVVWEVLSDPWLYASWVVGAARIRAVDGTWPAQGAKLHHSVGAWPFLLSDHTRVEEADAPRRLQLLARAWPGGEARVIIELAEHADQNTCTVTILEDAVRGPGRRFIPRRARTAALDLRNVESLRRLAFLAEGRRAT